MKFKLNQEIEGKVVAVEYDMAISWEDVTVKQFYELKKWDSKKEFSDLHLISILSGIPLGVILSNPFTQVEIDGSFWNLDDYLWRFVNFIEKSKIEAHVKEIEAIEIGGNPYLIPKQLNNPGSGQRFVLAQKNAMRDRLARTMNETGDAINCAEFIVACYFYPIVKGISFDTSDNPNNKFKSEEAEKFIEDLQDCKMVELYAVHNFFLEKLTASQIVRQPGLVLNQIKNKRLRKLVGSIFSRRLTPSTLSREEIY